MPNKFKKPRSKAKYTKKNEPRKASVVRSNEALVPTHLLSKKYLNSLPVDLQDFNLDEYLASVHTPVFIDPILYDLVQKRSLDPMIFDDFSELELGRLFIEAINNNQLTFFNVLLKLKERLHPGFNDNLALLKAIELNRITMVHDLLTDSRIDPRYGSIRPIDLALQLNNQVVKTLLFKHPLIVYSFFEQGVRDNNLKFIKSIFDKNVAFNPSCDNNEALKVAIENNHVKMVELILKDKRLEPSLQHNYPLRLARSLNRTKIVKLLENDHRVKFKQLLVHIHNDEIKSSLALFDECFDASQFALQEVQRKIFTAMILSVRRSRYSLYNKLLELPETNLAFNDFYTIKLICLLGNAKMLDEALFYLKKHNHRVVLDRVNGSDCLKLAITGKHYHCVEALLQSGLVNPSVNHNEALLFALFQEDYQMFSLLVNDKRVNVCGNQFNLYFEALQAKDLTYFELLYKLTPQQHLNHIYQVAETSYAVSVAAGRPINKRAINDILQKYHQTPFTPYYAMQASSRFLSDPPIIGRTNLNNDYDKMDDISIKCNLI